MKSFSTAFRGLAIVAVLAFALSFIESAYGLPVAAAAFLTANLTAATLVQSNVLGMRNILKCPDFTGNIAASGTATLTVPLGAALHQIIFIAKTAGTLMTVAELKSMITSLVCKANGKPVREWTPTSLSHANGTNGSQYATAAGYLIDYFSEPWRRTLEGEERGAWGTDGLDSLTYEVKFDASATTPTIEAYIVVDEFNRPFKAYPIRHVRSYPALTVINGTQQFPGGGILRESGLFYDRLHFLSSAITSVKVEVNKVVKFDNVPRTVMAELLSKRGLSMQSSVYTVAFSGSSQQLTDQLASFNIVNGEAKPITDLRLEWTGGSSTTADLVTEQYQIFK